ncbi:molybdenum cofactor guanylyltransferase [Pyrodictium abyssi]|uniref:MobA-like NTP transferase domain-containing protein n=1 Tax=Pyrodictium abyssi TaxID=54256 RepID=A0ABN6ZNW0_9CREN|nr:hypothetical protein PABY_15080 [Pyrodictium abyssi]
MELKIGLVLAGGEGRRFGGDKLLALVDGVASVARVARALRGAGAELVYAAVREERRCKLYMEAAGLDGCVYDPSWLGCGGPAAAFAGLEGLRGDTLFAAPGDMPWLEPGVLEKLEAFMDEAGGEAALPLHEGGFLDTLVAAIRWSLVERLPGVLRGLCGLRGELRASDPYRAAGRLVLVGSGLLASSPVVFSHINSRELLRTREPKSPLGPKHVIAVEPRFSLPASRDLLCRRLAREMEEYQRFGVAHLLKHASRDWSMFCGL